MVFDPEENYRYQIEPGSLPTFSPLFSDLSSSRPESPYLSLLWPYLGSESSAPEEPGGRFGPGHPLDVLASPFSRSIPDDPLDRFLAGKREFLARSVEDILGMIYEREGLRDEHLRKIDYDSCKVSTRLLGIDYWRLGANKDLDKLRMNLEREIIAFEREKRMEEVNCWRDTSRLRTDLREVMREASQEWRRDSLLSGDPP